MIRNKSKVDLLLIIGVWRAIYQRLRGNYVFLYSRSRPSTKLREGNIFSRVCPLVNHYVHREGSHASNMHWTSLYRDPSPVQAPLPTIGPYFTAPPQCYQAAITEDLFKLIHFRTPTIADTWWLLKPVTDLGFFWGGRQLLNLVR